MKKTDLLKKIIFSHIALLAANLIYAINYSFAKDVMPVYITPSTFILIRVLGALFLFSLAYFLFIREKIEKKDVIKLIFCSLFGIAINQLLFFERLNLTTPINASIVMTVNPVLVILLSFFILKDTITFKKTMGILLGLIGALTLILEGGKIDLSSVHQKGNFLVFINASSYALYLVLVKPLMQKYHPITIMFYLFSFGLFFVLPFGIKNLAIISWSTMPNVIYIQIVFVVVCTTFVAYLCNAIALKTLRPSVVSIYIYIQPILASVFAIFWGSDTLDFQKIVAAIFIFTGVYLVSVKSLNSKSYKLS